MSSPSHDFLFTLHAWQGAIVGVIGFAGVIITLASNSRISRKEHAREIEQRRLSIESLLLAEFELWRDAHVGYLMQFIDNNMEGVNLEIVRFPRFNSLISDDVVANLGLLEAGVCSAVAKAIVGIETLRRTANQITRDESSVDYVIPISAHSEFSESLDLALISLNNAGQKLDSEWKPIP